MVKWHLPDPRKILENESVELSEVEIERDISALFKAASIEENGIDIFKYSLAAGPFNKIEEFKVYLENKVSTPNSLNYTVYSYRLNKVVGNMSLLNINSPHGTAEVGSIWLTSHAQKTEINSQSVYLILTYLFDELKYRRVEWKCNNENENSKRAALRLGFIFEGIFRQHLWDKGCNRDTAWFSIIDTEWESVKSSFQNSLLKPY